MGYVRRRPVLARDVLGDAHRAEVVDRPGVLAVDLGGVPLVLLGHNLEHARQGVDGRVRVEERETRSPADEVGRVNGKFEAASVADLGLDDGVARGEPDAVQRPREAGRLGHRADRPGPVAVVLRQVLGDLLVEAELQRERGSGFCVSADRSRYPVADGSDAPAGSTWQT